MTAPQAALPNTDASTQETPVRVSLPPFMSQLKLESEQPVDSLPVS